MEHKRETKVVFTASEVSEDIEPPSAAQGIAQRKSNLRNISQNLNNDFYNEEKIKISPQSLEFLHKYFPQATL